MRKSLIVLLLVLAMLCGCSGRSRPFGVGLVVGGPTGIALKGWNGRREAMAAAVGFPDNATILQVDYLWHDMTAFRAESGELMPYYGIGVRAKLEENAAAEDKFSVRVPVGLNYVFDGGAVDLFLEIVPILDVQPDTDLDVDVAVGIRFFP